MKSFFENQSLFVIIWKWKIHLLIVGIITIFAAAIFSSSYFITPLFQSQARLYPANTNSYSEESESEQMLEVFNSTDIKRQVIDVFHLAERFDIKEDTPYFWTKVLRKYDDRVDCKKTEYESIELKVLDADAQVASDIVDSIIIFYDRKVLELSHQKSREEAKSYKRDLARKLVEIDSVVSKMEILRKEYGLLNYEIQTEQLTQGYMNALARAAPRAAVIDIQKRLDNLSEKGGEFFLWEGEMEALEVQRDTIRRRYDKAIAQAEKQVTYTMLVEKPFPADKKAFPTRWLIVLLSLIATEFLALVIIFSLEGIKSSKQ